MSPWTILGWIVLVLVVLFILLRLTIVVLEIVEKEGPKIKAHRKHKRALKGKVTCDYIAWENEYHPGQEDVAQYKKTYDRVRVICARTATHASTGRWRRYTCEEHAKHRSLSNDYPRPLHREEKPVKTRVVS